MDLTWLPLVGHSPAESPRWLNPVFFAIWVCLASFSVARHIFVCCSFHALFPFFCFLLSSTFRKPSNSKKQLWTQDFFNWFQHPTCRYKTAWLLFTASWLKALIHISCFSENVTTVCYQPLVPPSDWSGSSSKDCFIFFTAFWHLQWLSVCLLPLGLDWTCLNLRLGNQQSYRVAFRLFCICHLWYPWKGKEHEHGYKAKTIFSWSTCIFPVEKVRFSEKKGSQWKSYFYYFHCVKSGIICTSPALY